MRWVCHGHKHLGSSNGTHWFLVQGSDCDVSTQKMKPWFCDGEGCIWRPLLPSSEWQSRDRLISSGPQFLLILPYLLAQESACLARTV